LALVLPTIFAATHAEQKAAQEKRWPQQKQEE
jgi:hypothetical protein